MIVCVCNNVSESKIRLAVEAGISTLAQLRSNLEVGSCCGKCLSCARQVLRDCQPHVAPPSMVTHPVHFQTMHEAIGIAA
ncbi:(2Fe-2S)-binding protein [Undibacterium sp. Ren11W]|uniref:(2Fe-2S)-binding protein n=1 Tax=Undibacterium sp. Ren11W TaxID=3413045 RepID=UPI003BF0D571